MHMPETVWNCLQILSTALAKAFLGIKLPARFAVFQCMSVIIVSIYMYVWQFSGIKLYMYYAYMYMSSYTVAMIVVIIPYLLDQTSWLLLIS